MNIIKKIIRKKIIRKALEKDEKIRKYQQLPFYNFSPTFGIRGRICPVCFVKYKRMFSTYKSEKKFCSMCGTKIIKVRNHTYCSKCGKLLSCWNTFCHDCGTKIEEEAIEEGSEKNE